jgi:hypothetical protein
MSFKVNFNKLLFIFIYFVFIIIKVVLSKDYLLTDIGNGTQEIEVEFIKPYPIKIQDTVDFKVYIIKLKNVNVDVAAGMSGSPVFKDNKLVGALFASYDFQKEPIAFVMPIEYMNQLKNYPNFNLNLDNAKLKYMFAFNIPDFYKFNKEIIDNKFNKELSNDNKFQLNALNTFENFKIRLSKNYFVIENVYNDLNNNILNNSSSNDLREDNNNIGNGDSISVALVDGDIKIYGTGTLTKLEKDGTFLAFGHPMLGVGYIKAPVYKSKVITVINRYNESFKLSYIPDNSKLIGSLVFDGPFGVVGKLNEKPDMLPLNISILFNGKSLRSYNCQVIDNSKFIPYLSVLALYITSSKYIQDNQNLPFELNFKIVFENNKVQNIYLPSINGNYNLILSNLLKYLSFINSIPSKNNRIKFIDASLNIAPVNIGIINNIYISNFKDNMVEFNLNYFNPLNSSQGSEKMEVILPSEESNGTIYLGLGGGYYLYDIFDKLGITILPPKDFTEFLSYANVFINSKPKTIVGVIATNLWGVLTDNEKFIPLTYREILRMYFSFGLPYIYLSYYPVIFRKDVDKILIGMDFFSFDINGNISKAEKKKSDTSSSTKKSSSTDANNSYYSSVLDYVIKAYYKSYKNQDNKENTDNSNQDLIQQIQDILYDNFNQKKDSNLKDNNSKESKKESFNIDNVINLSNYSDLVEGYQNGVSIDYFSNLKYNKSFNSFIINKNFFKVLVYKDNLIGLNYLYNSKTKVSIFDKNLNLVKEYVLNYIISNTIVYKNYLLAVDYTGNVLKININTGNIESKFNFESPISDLTYYKDKLIISTVSFPSKIIICNLDNFKLLKVLDFPYLGISNLVVDDKFLYAGSYGGILIKINLEDYSLKTFNTFQDNITALYVLDNNLLVGTGSRAYFFVFDKNIFNNPVLYDGFSSDTNTYISDIFEFNGYVYLIVNSSNSKVYRISKNDLLGVIASNYQQTLNLNWQKILNFDLFSYPLKTVIFNDNIYLAFMDNSKTVFKFYNFGDSEGTYVSKVFDLETDKYLNDVVLNYKGKIDLEIRFGNSPIVDNTWTNWVNNIKNYPLKKSYRYFQYKLVLYKGSEIYSIKGLVGKNNRKPFVLVSDEFKKLSINNPLKVSYLDFDGDLLTIKLFVKIKGSKDNSKDNANWRLVDSKIVKANPCNFNNPSFESTTLDLTNLKNIINSSGYYDFKLIIDDKLSNVDNYFVQEFRFSLYISFDKFNIVAYDIKNNVINLKIESNSLVGAYLVIESDGDSFEVPLKLVDKIDNIWIFKGLLPNDLEYKNKGYNFYLVIKDEMGNTVKKNLFKN